MADQQGPDHVIDHIFLGSKSHARDRERLRALGITHILNVTPSKKLDPVAGVPNFFEKEKAFEYSRCPLFDNKAEDVTGALEGCVAFIERAKFYGRVLVHCNKGVSRSVSMVVAYLIKAHAMSYADAFKLVRSKRSVAQPNPSFERQLIAYADRMERLRKRRAMVAAGSEPSRSRAIGPSSGPPPKTLPASIGPSLPPHLLSRQAAAGDDAGGKCDEAMGKAEDGTDSSDGSGEIGPQRQSSALSKKRKPDEGEESANVDRGDPRAVKKRVLGPMAGPSQPPDSEKLA